MIEYRKFYVLVKPETKQFMVFDGDKRPQPSSALYQTPKVLGSSGLADNYQSAMNLDHDGGWEVAEIDLNTLSATITNVDAEVRAEFITETPLYPSQSDYPDWRSIRLLIFIVAKHKLEKDDLTVVELELILQHLMTLRKRTSATFDSLDKELGFLPADRLISLGLGRGLESFSQRARDLAADAEDIIRKELL